VLIRPLGKAVASRHAHRHTRPPLPDRRGDRGRTENAGLTLPNRWIELGYVELVFHGPGRRLGRRRTRAPASTERRAQAKARRRCPPPSTGSSREPLGSRRSIRAIILDARTALHAATPALERSESPSSRRSPVASMRRPDLRPRPRLGAGARGLLIRLSTRLHRPVGARQLLDRRFLGHGHAQQRSPSPPPWSLRLHVDRSTLTGIPRFPPRWTSPPAASARLSRPRRPCDRLPPTPADDVSAAYSSAAFTRFPPPDALGDPALASAPRPPPDLVGGLLGRRRISPHVLETDDLQGHRPSMVDRKPPPNARNTGG